MTWPKALPPVRPLPRTCCWPRAGRTLSPQTLLQTSDTLPFRSEKEVAKSPAGSRPRRWQPRACLPELCFIYLFIRLGGRRQSTRNGFGLKFLLDLFSSIGSSPEERMDGGTPSKRKQVALNRRAGAAHRVPGNCRASDLRSKCVYLCLASLGGRQSQLLSATPRSG